MKTPVEKARERNWLKARIIGGIPYIPAVSSTLTKEEAVILSEIHKLKNKLIDKWDENSVKLDMKVKNKKNETR